MKFFAAIRYFSFLLVFSYYTLMCIFYILIKKPIKVHEQIKKGCLRYLKMSNVSLDVRGLEYTKQNPNGSIIAPNHQSIMDVFGIFAIVEGSVGCLAKKSVSDIIPFGKKIFKYANFIAIDRSEPIQATRAIRKYMKTDAVNSNILIFPEGTRSRTGELLPFKDGSSFLAKRLGKQIIPTVICGTRDSMPVRKFLFYSKKKVYVEFLPPFNSKGMRTKDLTKKLENTIRERYDYVASYMSKGADVPKD